MSESIPSPAAAVSECSQANAVVEAAAAMAAQAAARAEAAKAKAAEAAARAAALRAAGVSELPNPVASQPVDGPTHNPTEPAPPQSVPAAMVASSEAAAAVLAVARAQSADRRKHFHRSGPGVAPGVPLEPVAHSAGLHVHGRHRRRILSPGLAGLLLLMAFFGLYATGNLPQFDRWTDHAVRATQADNAQVVGSIAGNWHGMAWAALALCFALMMFLLINRSRKDSSA